MSTRLIYLYRDASNYKEFGFLLLDGEMSVSEEVALRSMCEAGELFVAEQVGLPSLRERLAQRSGVSIDDHGWHELVSLESVNDERTHGTAVSEIVDRFAAVGIWRPHSSNLG